MDTQLEVQIDRAWWEQGIRDGKVIFSEEVISNMWKNSQLYHDAGLTPQTPPS